MGSPRELWGGLRRRSREVEWVRMGVRDGLRMAGTMAVCRQCYTAADLSTGLATMCSRCYDPVLKQCGNTCCTGCYGTGFEGGYKPPFKVWCSIMENSPQDDAVDKAGIRPDGPMTVKLPVDRIFHDGDVFAEIRLQRGGEVLELGRTFILDGPVRRQTVQGWVSDTGGDGSRSTVVEDILVSQEGTAKLVLPTDPIYTAGPDFWGVETNPWVFDTPDQATVETHDAV